ncbi:MAG: Ig-like domain repeat protein [Thermoleophilales bacterium]|nr:Ig-like domain repeat protein [Thermoleophilales bacterium]
MDSPGKSINSFLLVRNLVLGFVVMILGVFWTFGGQAAATPFSIEFDHGQLSVESPWTWGGLNIRNAEILPGVDSATATVSGDITDGVVTVKGPSGVPGDLGGFRFPIVVPPGADGIPITLVATGDIHGTYDQDTGEFSLSGPAEIRAFPDGTGDSAGSYCAYTLSQDLELSTTSAVPSPRFAGTPLVGAKFIHGLDGRGALTSNFVTGAPQIFGGANCGSESEYGLYYGGSIGIWISHGIPEPQPLPDTWIESSYSGYSGLLSSPPTFEFTSERGTSFECMLDTGPFYPCSSLEALANVADGYHKLYVRAVDEFGNVDPTPATRSFDLDTTPPDTLIDSGPSGTINVSSATFSFHGAVIVQCRIDSGSFVNCSSPQTFAGLVDGSHTVEFRAEDAAGNQDPTPATRTFTVDTISPETGITSGPSGKTSDPTPTFSFSASESSADYSCRVYLSGLTPSEFLPCVGSKGTHTTPGSLPDGNYTFEVRAMDIAGNIDPTPAIRTFTIDTGPPETLIDSGPSGTINVSSATFSFHGTPGDTAKVQCRIDSGPFVDCVSSQTFAGLVDGSHTVKFRAEDAAGNQDPTPATRTFTVDTTVYKASVKTVRVSGPAKARKGKKVTYKVKITNVGNATATGVKLKVKGRGINSSTSVGTISAGKTSTVGVKVKCKKQGEFKITFNVTSKNAGSTAVEKAIKVTK